MDKGTVLVLCSFSVDQSLGLACIILYMMIAERSIVLFYRAMGGILRRALVLLSANIWQNCTCVCGLDVWFEMGQRVVSLTILDIGWMSLSTEMPQAGEHSDRRVIW